MRIHLLTVLLVCGVLANVAEAQNPPARGQDPKKNQNTRDARPDPRPPFKWWAIDSIRQEIKLSAEQAAEINKIFQSSMDRLKIDKDDFDRAQANFSEYMEKTAASEREFQRAVDQLELTRYNMNKERTMMLVRIHSVLTPDQRKGLEAIRKRNDGDRKGQSR